MELLSVSVSGKPLVLSASENGLFLHSIPNEHFGRPALLCSNYKSGLSGCNYNDSLYYAYINKEDSLLVRSINETTLLYRLDSTSTLSYRMPQLISFNDTLLLFFFTQSETGYRLHVRFLFSDSAPLPLPESVPVSFTEPPVLFLHADTSVLYLSLRSGNVWTRLYYDNDFVCHTLATEEEYLSTLRIPWTAEKEHLEHRLLQTLRFSEQQQKLLTEKKQALSALESDYRTTVTELQSVRSKLAESETRNRELSLLLERAKTQYNELMSVAEQYREEALKWYGKFTDRN